MTPPHPDAEPADPCRPNPVLRSRAGESQYFARAVNLLTVALALLLGSLLTHTELSHHSPHPISTLRQSLTTHLANPNLALTLAAVGALLLLAECNLPGAILPGALGLLLLLSGLFGLSLHPIRPSALVALLLSAALLALSARLPLFGIPALLGTLGLLFGIKTLSPAISLLPAIATGLTLGPLTSLLGRIAWKAHGNKAHRPSIPPSASQGRLEP